MADIKTHLGYARAWVRLCLEKKLLYEHLSTLLSEENLLRYRHRINQLETNRFTTTTTKIKIKQVNPWMNQWTCWLMNFIFTIYYHLFIIILCHMILYRWLIHFIFTIYCLLLLLLLFNTIIYLFSIITSYYLILLLFNTVNTICYRKLYKRYGFLRCEEERNLFLTYLLTLNAADYHSFTHTYPQAGNIHRQS